MILLFVNIRKVPRVVLKTFSRDLANKIEWKIMFDPSINVRLQRDRLTVFTGSFIWRRKFLKMKNRQMMDSSHLFYIVLKSFLSFTSMSSYSFTGLDIPR